MSTRHRACTLDEYVGHNEHAVAALAAAREYVDAFSERRRRGEGLFLCGGTGTGKSHLAYGVVNALLASEHDVQALIVRAVDLFHQLKRGYGGDAARSEESAKYWEAVKAAPLLVIDDLGVAKPTEWVQEQTYDLLDHRYNQDERPTIITSNVPPDRLAERIGARAASRIHEMCRIVHVPGEDVRVMMAEARDGCR